MQKNSVNAQEKKIAYNISYYNYICRYQMKLSQSLALTCTLDQVILFTIQSLCFL